jgi:hypothetical protein
MRLLSPAASALRVPRRTLRAQLALLYAALFGLSCVAVAAVAVIFKPNFVVGSSCAAAPQTPGHPDRCGQYAHLSFVGTISHDAKQNLAGLAMVAAMMSSKGRVASFPLALRRLKASMALWWATERIHEEKLPFFSSKLEACCQHLRKTSWVTSWASPASPRMRKDRE